MTELQTENARLLRLVKEGDEDALSRLVEENMGLVKSIALRFKDRGTEYEDLVQIGVIGMIKAIQNFDFSFGTAFSTYAVPLIIGEIRRHLRDDGMIKVGREVRKAGAHIMREKERFLMEEGREPRLNELAVRCEMTVEEMVYALEAVSPVRSLSEPFGREEEEGATLGDMIAEREDAIEGRTEDIALKQAIATLPELQQKILNLRYFHHLSQQRTALLLGLTQVKVSREEKKIMEKLRLRLLK